MRIRRIIPCALLVSGLFVCLCACSKTPVQSSATPDSNETSEMRLAALSPAIAVMLRDLGLEDRIVAKHDYDMILSDRVPAAGSELGFDLEVLLGARPTHLFFQSTSVARSPKLLEIAQREGWVIFERPLETLDDIAATMDDLHYFFNGSPERQRGQYDMSEMLAQSLPSAKLADAWRSMGPGARGAGRVLVLGSVDPIGAMGPGSYHYQIIERLGATPAITDGAMWIELDYEDLITLDPDSIILIAPRVVDTDAERFAEPSRLTLADAKAMLGPIADLPISAIEHDRIGVIDHPLGLLPSGALGEVAEEMRELILSWYE